MSASIFLLTALSMSGCTQSGMQKKVGPAPSFIASTDEHFIARGRYLAEHVTGCTSCHSTVNDEVFARPVVAGTEGMGGQTWPLADGKMGQVTAGNITPFGVGEWTDGELLHAMTAGIHKDGYALFPVMPYPTYSKLTESDAKAIVSYLRTLKPVESPPTERRLSVILTKVANMTAAPPEWSVPPGLNDILAKGEYLANAAGCVYCHTPDDGKKLDKSQLMAGGRTFKMAMGTAIAPNITPAEGRGIGYWGEQDFLNKFKSFRTEAARVRDAGPTDPNTVMPWFEYAGMTDDDLGAIWVYLQAQAPSDNEVPATWIVH
jgi:mono/diheme cytochrome c family protein